VSEDPNRPPPNDFDARLRQAQQRHGIDSQRPEEDATQKNAIGLAFRMGMELVSALLVGLGIGWLIDRWLDTAPWALVVMFFVGAGAGIMNVYRAVSGLGYAPGYKRPSNPGDRNE